MSTGKNPFGVSVSRKRIAGGFAILLGIALFAVLLGQQPEARQPPSSSDATHPTPRDQVGVGPLPLQLGTAEPGVEETSGHETPASLDVKLTDATFRTLIRNAPVRLSFHTGESSSTSNLRSSRNGMVMLPRPADGGLVAVDVPGFETVSVHVNQQATGVLELPARGHAVVHVLEHETGLPIAGAGVLVASSSADAFDGQPRGITATTDNAGRASFGGLPPGIRLRLVVNIQGYIAPAPVSIFIEPSDIGLDHKFEITLQPTSARLVRVIGIPEDWARLLVVKTATGLWSLDRIERRFEWNAVKQCAEAVVVVPRSGSQPSQVSIIGPLGILLACRTLQTESAAEVEFSPDLDYCELAVVSLEGLAFNEGRSIRWESRDRHGLVTLGAGGRIAYLIGRAGQREVVRLRDASASSATLVLPADKVAAMIPVEKATLVLSTPSALSDQVAIWKSVSGKLDVIAWQPAMGDRATFELEPGEYYVGTRSQILSGRIRIGSGDELMLDGRRLIEASVLLVEDVDKVLQDVATATVYLPLGPVVRFVAEAEFVDGAAQIRGLTPGKYLLHCTAEGRRQSVQEIVVSPASETTVIVKRLALPIVVPVILRGNDGQIVNTAVRIRGLPFGLGFGKEFQLASGGPAAFEVLQGMPFECTTVDGRFWLVSSAEEGPVDLPFECSAECRLTLGRWWRDRTEGVRVVGGEQVIRSVSLKPQADNIWAAKGPPKYRFLLVALKDGRTAVIECDFVADGAHELAAPPSEHRVFLRCSAEASSKWERPLSASVFLEEVGASVLSGSSLSRLELGDEMTTALRDGILLLGRGKITVRAVGYTSRGALAWESAAATLDFSRPSTTVTLHPVRQEEAR